MEKFSLEMTYEAESMALDMLPVNLKDSSEVNWKAVDSIMVEILASGGII